jgi:hypothetical protein
VSLAHFRGVEALHELDHVVELFLGFLRFHCRVSFDIVNIEAAFDTSCQGFAHKKNNLNPLIINRLLQIN